MKVFCSITGILLFFSSPYVHASSLRRVLLHSQVTETPVSPMSANDVEEALLGGAAMQKLHESRRIRDAHLALSLPSTKIDVEALKELGVNMEGPLSYADKPDEIIATKAYKGQLSEKFLILMDKYTGKHFLELSINAMKMPVVNAGASNQCFIINYQPTGGDLKQHAICAPTLKEASKWVSGIMAARFSAALNQKAKANPEEEGKLPENSTKDYRWYTYIQEMLIKKGEAEASSLMSPEEFAKKNVINVEVRNVHRTPQVSVNGQKIDYTKN